MKEGQCEVNGCSKTGVIVYYGHNVCDKCHGRHCNDSSKFDLKQEFEVVSEKMTSKDKRIRKLKETLQNKRILKLQERQEELAIIQCLDGEAE